MHLAGTSEGPLFHHFTKPKFFLQIFINWFTKVGVSVFRFAVDLVTG